MTQDLAPSPTCGAAAGMEPRTEGMALMRRALIGFTTGGLTALALALVMMGPSPASATTVVDEWHVDAQIGSIVASPDGARLYVATTDHVATTTRIDVLDALTGAVITQYPSPAFSSVPYDLALSGDGARLFATSYDTNEVFVFETGPGSAGEALQTGAGPMGVVQAADGRIWVALRGADALQVFDPAVPDAPVTVPIGAGTAPTALALSPDGTLLYSANTGNGTVTKIVVSSLLATPVTTAVGGAPSGIIVSPDGTHVIVATDTGDQLVELDASTLAVTATVAMASATAPAALPGSGRIVVARGDAGAVDLVDDTSLAILETVTPIPAAQTAIAVSPDRTRVFVGSSDGTISLLDGDTAPVITTTALPDGVTGVGYSATVAATGSPAPTFAVTSGALPAGLALDPTTGAITGSPTATGTATFEITATNTIGTSAAAPFSITVRSIPHITTADPLPDGDLGEPYTTTITATGVPAPTFSVTSGALPAGLTLDATTGVISGTPTEASPDGFAFSVTATNAAGTDARAFRISIRTEPWILTSALPDGDVGEPYSATIAAAGVPAPTFAVTSGSLPPGLELDPTTGVISGTPTELGRSSLRITATNSTGDAARDYSITVHGVPLVPVTPVTPLTPVAPLPAKLTPTGLEVAAPLLVAGGIIAIGVLAVGMARMRRRA